MTLLILAAFVLLAVIAVAWLEWESRKPLTPFDEYCSRVDQELDERERRVEWTPGGGWRLR